ncbi:hypothetical protein VPH35_065821 [Triticum aestivum]
MASSSSSAPLVGVAAPEDIAPLPLIRCPRCNLGVIQWFISETPLNPGHHSYNYFFQSRRCSLWKWENKYIDYLRACWSHVFQPAVLAPPDASILVLREIQFDVKIALCNALDAAIAPTCRGTT